METLFTVFISAGGSGVLENRLATQSSVEESDGELAESGGSVQLMRLKSKPYV